MVRAHARKSQRLALLLSVDDPLVSLVDAFFGVVCSDFDASIAGIFFKGFVSFYCLLGGGGLLQVSEAETQYLVDIDRYVFLALGCQDPRHLGN